MVCVDFGSTFTKAALVDLDSGDLLATASHSTTLPDAAGRGDVLDGYDACMAALTEQDQVVPRDERPLDLGEHGVLEADDAGEGRLAGGEAGEQD